jgi:hypothetical protein
MPLARGCGDGRPTGNTATIFADLVQELRPNENLTNPSPHTGTCPRENPPQEVTDA